MTTEIVHECPHGDDALTPCCGRSPFELLGDRMTVYPELVSCLERCDAPEFHPAHCHCVVARP